MKKTELRILLIGYGKMGRAVEQLAKAKGHSIVAIVSDRHSDLANICTAYQPNIAFEFTSPESAIKNLQVLIEKGIPTVCGSTGWLEHWDKITHAVAEKKGTLFYAANYSMGMNLMFKLTELSAQIMDQLPEYEVEIEEIHHTEKKDMPSGSAISLAERLLKNIKRKTSWLLNNPSEEKMIGINSLREPNVPGTHLVTFKSPIDTIQISHTANNRNGFAAGAIMAAEWLLHKKGVFTMDDLWKDKFKV